MRALPLLLLALVCACDGRVPPDSPPAVLLFSGTGTSAGDVSAIEALLRAAHLSYEKSRDARAYAARLIEAALNGRSLAAPRPQSK